MSKPLTQYKAAAIILYHHKRGFFLGLETKKGWKHFGGKRESTDECALQTAERELNEEVDGQYVSMRPYNVYYHKDSKMLLFLKRCDNVDLYYLDHLSATNVKTKYAWVKPEDVSGYKDMQSYIKQQLLLVMDSSNRITHIK